MLKRMFSVYSSRSRRNRGKIFNKFFYVDQNTSILDLGGGDGKLISTMLPYKEKIVIADILPDDLAKASRSGFKTLQLDESGTLPFKRGDFDIIFSNSVIEHVTVDKDEIYSIKRTSAFRKAAFERQKRFASEIREKSSRYYVQTPYKYFPIESHSWLPFFIIFFPRRLQIKMITFFNKFWPKKTTPDWNLLTVKEMKLLFPEATIVKEKSFFCTKSLIAIKA